MVGLCRWSVFPLFGALSLYAPPGPDCPGQTCLGSPPTGFHLLAQETNLSSGTSSDCGVCRVCLCFCVLFWLVVVFVGVFFEFLAMEFSGDGWPAWCLSSSCSGIWCCVLIVKDPSLCSQFSFLLLLVPPPLPSTPSVVPWHFLPKT